MRTSWFSREHNYRCGLSCNAGYCRNFDDNNLHDWQPNPNAPMVDVQINNVGSQNGARLLCSGIGSYRHVAVDGEPGYNGRWCCGEFCYDYKVIDDGDPQNVLNLHPVFYIYRNGKGFKFTSSVTVTETDGWHPHLRSDNKLQSGSCFFIGVVGTVGRNCPQTTPWDPVTNMILNRVAFEIDYNGGDEIAAFDNACFNPTYLSATSNLQIVILCVQMLRAVVVPILMYGMYHLEPASPVVRVVHTLPEFSWRRLCIGCFQFSGWNGDSNITKTTCCNPCDPSNLIPSLYD